MPAIVAATSVLPLLPVLIPLVGAFVICILPRRLVTTQVGWGVYVSALLCTVFCLLLLPGLEGNTDSYLSLFSPPNAMAPLAVGQTLSLQYDGLALHLSLVLALALLLVGLASWTQPVDRSSAVSRLVLVAGAVAACAADNLVGLVMAWGIHDLAFLWLLMARPPEEGIRRARREAFVALLSTAALTMGLASAAARSGDISFPLASLPTTAAVWLGVAVLLRLGLYRLPGRPRTTWEGFLGNLSIGACLWWRVSSAIAWSTLPVEAISLVGGAFLLVTGVLAFLAASAATPIPYLRAHSILILVLGPIVGKGSGQGVIVSTVLALGQSVVLVYAARQLAAEGRAAWARLVELAALAVLAGMPLTAGFLARWRLLELSWQVGPSAPFALAAVSCLLCAYPFWRRLLQHLVESSEKRSAAPRGWSVALGCAIVTFVASVTFGIDGGWFGRVLGAPVGTEALSIGSFIERGTGAAPGAILMLAMAAGYGLERLSRRAPMAGVSILGEMLDVVWLYDSVEVSLNRLRGLSRAALDAIGSPLYVAWALTWALLLTRYLAER